MKGLTYEMAYAGKRLVDDKEFVSYILTSLHKQV
jgi:hypothetical protein